MDLLQYGGYRTVVVALFCGCLFIAVCILLVGCRRRWLVHLRRRRRERKLRQQIKRDDALHPGELDVRRCSQVRDQRQRTKFHDDSPEVTTVRRTPPSTSAAAVLFSHNVCHCLPRGLRRKSPATAVIRRGQSFDSLALGRRSDGSCGPVIQRLTRSPSQLVLARSSSTSNSRPDLVRTSASDNDCTSGAERWKPITVAGETMFPVQPSAAIFLSFDFDDSV